MKHLHLAHNWLFKQRSSTLSLPADFTSSHEWLPATVPGTVHQDLLANGRIPDPFQALNENEVQWVGTSEWLYKCAFDLPADFGDADEIVLCFDGLDTFATAWLNDTQILISENMFVPQRISVASLLHPGSNALHILFTSAFQRGKELEEHYGGKRAVWNGDASRVYIRKAQYHYGWDWGPTLLTAGIWKAIRLESYSTRIADLHCPALVAEDLQSATLPIHITFETHTAFTDLAAHMVLYSPEGETVAEAQIPITDTELEHTFSLASPQLWWPNGYGKQPFYRLEVTLLRGAEELDRQEARLGLRRLRLVQHPFADEPGISFFFEINNTPVFCGGANWIPADSFTPRVTPEQYRAWVQLAAAAHMTMLRVWGGGIYEDEAFYNACDELGLLVWQDFLFACGIYPAHTEFQETIRAEAEAAVRRLRHHPSLVIWAGNNEDYAIASSINVYDPTFEGDFTQTAFPARALYERLLPDVCARLDPTRPYWRGSPYGGSDSGDLTLGDQHVWSVWHGAVPYQDYPKFAGRFVSEFGMQAFPVMETIKDFAEPAEFYPQSRTLDFHNKDAGGPRRLAPYLIENVRIVADLAGYAYLTQFVQSEALATAFRSWRRRWSGPGREYTAGALVWQLNDCWPVTSWAIVDYYLRPKPAYYAIRRELAPFGVGLARTSAKTISAWTVAGAQSAGNAELEIRTWTLAGTLLSEERRSVVLAANQSVEQGEFASERNDAWVVAARLFKDGSVVARTTLWPEPFKYLTLPDPDITIEHPNEDTLYLHTKRPVKGVWLSAGDGVTWSDNMLDLLPDDPQTVVAQGLKANSLQVKWLAGQ
jgi:beta-mannosidase